MLKVFAEHLAVGQNQWYHFGVGEFTTQFRTDLSGWIESDVHWGLTDLDLDFDPGPPRASESFRALEPSRLTA